MSETLGCGHPDKNRACGDCLDEAVEAIERARTYTGLEAEGCPLCTYVDGVFTAACSFHRKLAALELQNRLLKESIWKHLHIKHERTVCPMSVGMLERCCEIIMRDAGLDPKNGEFVEKRKCEHPGPFETSAGLTGLWCERCGEKLR